MLRATHLRLSFLSISMNFSAKGTRTSGEFFFSSAWAASFPTVCSAIIVVMRWKWFGARACEQYNVASMNRVTSVLADTLPEKGKSKNYLVRRSGHWAGAHALPKCCGKISFFDIGQNDPSYAYEKDPFFRMAPASKNAIDNIALVVYSLYLCVSGTTPYTHTHTHTRV